MSIWDTATDKVTAFFSKSEREAEIHGGKVFYLPFHAAEKLCDAVVSKLAESQARIGRILDVMYGSGSIGVAMCKRLPADTSTQVLFNDLHLEKWVNLELSDLEREGGEQRVITTYEKPLSELPTCIASDLLPVAPTFTDLVILDPTITSKQKSESPQKYEGSLADLASAISALLPSTGWLLLGAERDAQAAEMLSQVGNRIAAGYKLTLSETDVKHPAKSGRWALPGQRFWYLVHIARGIAEKPLDEATLATWPNILGESLSATNVSSSRTLSELAEDFRHAVDIICGDRAAACTPRNTLDGATPEESHEVYRLISCTPCQATSIPLNLLFKGVTGTGKSREVDKIITECLKIPGGARVLRINVHTATTNSHLMQGIGVSLRNGAVEYAEKRGLVLGFLIKAIQDPGNPYALVLEEVQENSLNSLIGDLIYLIEADKRCDVSAACRKNPALCKKEFGSVGELVQDVIDASDTAHSVTLPALVDHRVGNGTPLIFPKNVYVMCTTNFRDDRKIMEDNLVRRFDLIEISPDVTATHKEVRILFSHINKGLLALEADIGGQLRVGHASWTEQAIGSNVQVGVARAMLQALHEWRDIRHLEWSHITERVLTEAALKMMCDLTRAQEPLGAGSYSELISQLQIIAYGDWLYASAPSAQVAVELVVADN